MPATSPAAPRPGSDRWGLKAPLLLVVVACALRLWMPGPALFTLDELNWSARSERFGDAVAAGDLASANVGPADEEATRPGVTTMWIGVLGERAAEARPLGTEATTTRWTHALMGLVTALLLWPFVVLAARLVGRRAAVVAGGLVAVEPLLVGHSAIQHTDALVTMAYGLAAVALIAALEARREEDLETPDGPATPWWRRASVRLGAVFGAAAALGCLTKLSILPLLAALVVTLLVVHRRGLEVVGAGAAAFVVVTLVAWPALWVDPMANLRATIGSGELATSPSRHLFLGSVVEGGDWRFYAVELWFRASPWLLVGALVALAATIARRLSGRTALVPRRVAWPLGLPALVYLVVISLSDKQYGRYLLPLLPVAAIGLGVVAAALVERVGAPRWARVGGWAGFAAAAVFTAALAPYAIAFVDPLVGGQRRAEDAIQLGWGEGREVVLAEYLRRADGGCPTWSAAGPMLLACPGQDLGWLDGDDPPPRYVFTYVGDRQLGIEPPELRRQLAEHGELLLAARIDGVPYAELWELPEAGASTGGGGGARPD